MLFGTTVLEHQTPAKKYAADSNIRPSSAGRLGSKVRNSINQAANLKPTLILSGRSLQPTPIAGRPSSSAYIAKRDSHAHLAKEAYGSYATNAPVMSAYLTAASTNQSQSRFRSQKKSVSFRKHSYDNRGIQG